MRMRLPAADVTPALARAGRVVATAPMALPVVSTLLGGDVKIGHIFRNMRAATRLPREAIARRLATTAATIEDLENGAVSSLPHWRETVRIVRSYCELLRLDPEPILWRIHRQLQTGSPLSDSPDSLGGLRGCRMPSCARTTPDPAPLPEGGGGAREECSLSAPPSPWWLPRSTSLKPRPRPSIVPSRCCPQPVGSGARAVMDSIMLFSAPRRDGLRWIDVGDPRLRKVDKLQTSVR